MPPPIPFFSQNLNKCFHYFGGGFLPGKEVSVPCLSSSTAGKRGIRGVPNDHERPQIRGGASLRAVRDVLQRGAVPYGVAAAGGVGAEIDGAGVEAEMEKETALPPPALRRA